MNEPSHPRFTSGTILDFFKSFLRSPLFQKAVPKVLLWLTPLLLLTYTTLRAKNLSMTHDECGSFLIWTDFPIFTCFYDPVCWGSANLHFLYVLLMKASIGLFGVSELALRLPALLGHAVYMFFSWKLISSWTSRHWLVLAGFLLLNLNPFQLEFFSLARGYGLANSCMMASLYFLYRYVQAEKTTAALAMFGWAVLAVMSNFTMLTYFACLTALFTGLVLVKKVKWQKPVLIAGGAAVLLTDLLYLPIKTLFEKGEFEYGTDTFWKSVHALVRASMYGVKYLREYNVQVLGGILLVLLTAALVSSIRAFLKAPQNRKNQFFLAASLLPLLASLSAIVQHHLLGTNYTLNRTSLLFIPMAALPVFLLFEHWLQQKSSWWRVVVPVLITGFVAGHAKRSFQTQYTGEWYYDHNTKAMLEYLDEKLPGDTTIALGVHWLFHPASTFYIRTVPYRFTGDLVYSKKLRTDSLYDYYYVPFEDVKKLHPSYVPEKRFEGTGILMRRK